jgi:anti-sigma regulatory factor (Ser/Thr protein kinase)
MSINRLAIRTELSTPSRYTENASPGYPLRKTWKPATEVIRIELLGSLSHRDVALRAVSAACKLVTARPFGPVWNDFQMEVVSAFGEAFNNVVQHGYRGNSEGLIQIDVRISSGRIDIDLSDWGNAFDPKAVPPPDLDRLPESGLGLYIMQSFMDMSYRPGQPNVLTLSKSLRTGREEPETGRKTEGEE